MYRFVLRDDSSSVYGALAALLKEKSHWSQVKKDNFKFHLMLGEKNRLPWSLLGEETGHQQMVNYYRGASVICRKVSFARKVAEYLDTATCTDTDLNFSCVPTSFIVCPQSDSTQKTCSDSQQGPNITPDNEKHSCRLSIKEMKLRARKKSDSRNALTSYCIERSKRGDCPVWIAKSSFGCKGDGIRISTDPQELIDYIDSESQSYVVQEYITSPMLLDGGRKFDIRCWILLDHNFDIHLCKEGVLRTSSEKYDGNYSNLIAHLTNHHLQKQFSNNYGKYEKGNEMFFPEFDSFLQKNYGVRLEETIIPQIKRIVVDSLFLIKEEIETDRPYKSFQLFGYDFLLDDRMKTWLLEINANPACAEKLLPDLVKSIYHGTICDVYPEDQTSYAEYTNLFTKIS